jgi:hypothetical protein
LEQSLARSPSQAHHVPKSKARGKSDAQIEDEGKKIEIH